MKKVIMTGSLVCGTILVMGLSTGLTVQADELTGNTAIGAEVIKGDTVLEIDKNTNFGQKSLSDVVNFGTQDINYTVTDYTGTKNGFSISAKLTDTDATRSLKVSGEELSETAVEVVNADTNAVGANVAKVEIGLVYTKAQDTKVFNSTIEWELTKATTKSISE